MNIHETPATYEQEMRFTAMVTVPSRNAEHLKQVTTHILRTPTGEIEVGAHWKDACRVQANPLVLVHRNFFGIEPGDTKRTMMAEVKVTKRNHPEYGEDLVLDICPVTTGQAYELKIGSDQKGVIAIPKTEPVKYLTLKAIPPRP